MLGVVSSAPAVSEAVAARLEGFLDRRRIEASEYGPDAAAMIDAAAATLVGGKRLRARFCHTGWLAVARVREPAAAETSALWDVCAALEIFQSAALVHDDIIDNSDTRRGRPSAHRLLERGHIDAGWTGDPASFGRSAAILLGDLLVAWSDDLLEEALSGEEHAEVVRREYGRMRRDVTVGQYLDIAEESAWSVNAPTSHLDRALRIASLKSARYSIEQPLALGAAFAGADAGQLLALRHFGHPVGMAFQLRDDVLGVFGDETLTGKPAGDDLREGKRTALIALTRQTLDGSARAAFDGMIGDPALTSEQVATLQTMIEASGALTQIEAMIDDYAVRADEALTGASLDGAAVGKLRDLATAATTRSA